MPAAATSTSTSPGPGSGNGRIAGTSTSGPPLPFASMTVMVSGSMKFLRMFSVKPGDDVEEMRLEKQLP